MDASPSALPAPSRRSSFSAPPLPAADAAVAAVANDPTAAAQFIRNLQTQMQQAMQTIQGLEARLQHIPTAPSAHSPPALAALGQALAAVVAMPTIPAFSGKETANSLGREAEEWLNHAERVFQLREATGSAAVPDHLRLAHVNCALTGPAQEWYTALVTKPTTWAAFRTAVLQRYQVGSTARLLEAKLRRLSTDAARAKLSIDGVRAYLHQFLNVANRLRDSEMLQHTKVGLLIEGLPVRYREFAIREDEAAAERAVPLTIATLADRLLRRTAHGELAAAGYSGGGASGSSGATAMDLSAISVAQLAETFGVTPDLAAAYLESEEGWAEHDTSVGGSAAALSRPAEDRLAAVERSLHALTQAVRRPASSAPRGLPDSIPEALAEARKAAGLCVRCGVAAYAPGKGHNRRTCKAAEDKTTSVKEGARRAGVPARPDFQ